MTTPPAVPPPPDGDPIYVAEPYPPPGYADPYAMQPPYPAYPYGVQPEAAVPRRIAPGFGWLLFAVGVLTAIASLLPWAVFFGLSVDGTKGDGTVTVLCAVVICAIGLIVGLGHGLMWAPITSLGVAGLITITALADIENVTRLVDSSPDSFSPDAVTVGPGLWLTLIAGVAGIAVSGMAMLWRRPE